MTRLPSMLSPCQKRCGSCAPCGADGIALTPCSGKVAREHVAHPAAATAAIRFCAACLGLIECSEGSGNLTILQKHFRMHQKLLRAQCAGELHRGRGRTHSVEVLWLAPAGYTACGPSAGIATGSRRQTYTSSSGCASMRNPDERSIASVHARFGTHQLVWSCE